VETVFEIREPRIFSPIVTFGAWRRHGLLG